MIFIGSATKKGKAVDEGGGSKPPPKGGKRVRKELLQRMLASMEENQAEAKKEVFRTFRSGLGLTIDLLADLTIRPSALALLHSTPFSDFVQALENKNKLYDNRAEVNKAPKVLYRLISNYKEDSKRFLMGGQLLKSDPNCFALVFSIRRLVMTTEDLEKYSPKDDRDLSESEFYTTYFPLFDENGKKKSKVKLLKSDIEKGIRRTANVEGKELDFVRLMILFMLCTIFLPTINASYVHIKYLYCVQSLEAINKVSWPDLIHDNLMKSVSSTYKTPYSVAGCTLYLLVSS